MQKWEYCAIGPISKGNSDNALKVDSMSNRNTFNLDGRKIKPIIGTDGLGSTIYKLGLEGWEMVGCGNVSENSHFIYFKRPIEEV